MSQVRLLGEHTQLRNATETRQEPEYDGLISYQLFAFACSDTSHLERLSKPHQRSPVSLCVAPGKRHVDTFHRKQYLCRVCHDVDTYDVSWPCLPDLHSDLSRVPEVNHQLPFLARSAIP